MNIQPDYIPMSIPLTLLAIQKQPSYYSSATVPDGLLPIKYLFQNTHGHRFHEISL